MSIETGVVLAAGEGTRLRPLTRNRPKPMLPAANHPILEYVIDTLVDAGMGEIALVVGYKRDRVQEHFGPTYRDVPLTYVHQEKQLGSGHALLQAREAVSGPLLVVNGDRVIAASMVRQVVETFEHTGDPTLAVLEHPNTNQYGAVALDGGAGGRGGGGGSGAGGRGSGGSGGGRGDGSGGRGDGGSDDGGRDGDDDAASSDEGARVTELVEKPTVDTYRLINAGIYGFSSDVFDAVEATPRRDGELRLPDMLARRIDYGDPVRGVHTEGLWADATYPWDLLYLARRLLVGGRVAEPERAGEEGVFVAESARVDEAATLQPPVVVGPDAEIAAGAVVGPDVAVGRNATIGANATVERAVLDADARVGPTSTLLDCVAGQDVNLGAGMLVPGGLADVRVGTEVFENQRLGAVLADRVTARGGVTCAPGTLVGPSARLGPGVTVEGWVEEGARVVR